MKKTLAIFASAAALTAASAQAQDTLTISVYSFAQGRLQRSALRSV